jgi:hypothetical protein
MATPKKPSHPLLNPIDAGTSFVERSMAKLSSPNGAKRKLEALLGLRAFAAAYFYVWVYQEFLGLHLELIELKTLLRIPIISLVVFPLVYYLYVKPDPLQRAGWRSKPVVFFQSYMPSKYIRDRCQRCRETSATCRNFIGPDSFDHVTIWFDIWRGFFAKDFKDLFEDTFERGYTCKLLFGLTLAMGFFGILGILTMAWGFIWNRLMHRALLSGFDPLHVIFVLVCAGIVLLIQVLNSPDTNKPSGCWHAWREINQGHILRLRQHDELLVEKVCHAGGNANTFRPR